VLFALHAVRTVHVKKALGPFWMYKKEFEHLLELFEYMCYQVIN
jgi:hypothetical protein